jgi:zinc ribbon protein
MKFCPNCGKPVHTNASFCGECGADMREFEVAADAQGASEQSSQASTKEVKKNPKTSSSGIIRSGAEVRVFKDPMIDESELAGSVGKTSGEDDGEIDLSKAIEQGAIDTGAQPDEEKGIDFESDEDLEEALEDGSVIRREDLMDDDGVELICKMCGEEIHVAMAILKHKPVNIKCRACDFEWLIR